MWTSERQRLAFRSCSRIAYAMTGVAFVLVVSGPIAFAAFTSGAIHDLCRHGTSPLRMLLWGVGFAAMLMLLGVAVLQVAWWLARRRGFNDPECR